MNSKRYVLIFVSLLAVLAGLYFLKSKPKTTTPPSLTDFTVENPEDVSLIFMTDQSGDNQIFLRKQSDGTWTVNDSFVAWQKEVDFLLDETMAKVKVQGPAPAAAIPNVIKYMSIHGIKVEVYSDNMKEPDHVYIVGNTTPTQLGTYFKLPGDNPPAIMTIPGFDGFVNTRYSVDLDHWISRTVFGSTKDQIEEVEVTYPEEKESFKIEHTPDDKFLMTSLTITDENKNTGAIKSYCNLFEKRNFETFVYVINDSLKAALSEQQPFATIRVKSKNRGIDELKFYPKNANEKMHGLYDEDGMALVNDPSRYYAIYNKLERVLIVQDYTFKNVLLKANDFKNRTN